MLLFKFNFFKVRMYIPNYLFSRFLDLVWLIRPKGVVVGPIRGHNFLNTKRVHNSTQIYETMNFEYYVMQLIGSFNI